MITVLFYRHQGMSVGGLMWRPMSPVWDDDYVVFIVVRARWRLTAPTTAFFQSTLRGR